jgi:serine/threonine protein kinase
LHRDIRPENIIINDEEHCTIIDLGAAGLIDAPRLYNDTPIPGDLLYAAPEYFIGDVGTELSDQFSLAVLCYTLLCGRYPYGTKLAHCRTRANQQKLKYQSAIDGHTRIPQ